MNTAPVKSQMLNIRIDPDTLAQLKAAAEEDERTLSWMALNLIKKGLTSAKRKAKSKAA